MAATIKDIAKMAKVSTATVSRVLTNKDGFFSLETGRKIREIAEQLGYQKNTAAMELVTKRSNVLGVVVSSTKTNFSTEIIAGIQEIAYQHGLSVIILYAGSDNSELQKKALQTVIERSVMGILILAISLTEPNLVFLEHSNIPFLFLSISFPKESLPFISSDDFQIGYQSTAYLLAKGHRKIGFAGADITDSFTAQKRLEGYRSALIEHNIKVNDQWVVAGDFSYQSGLDAMSSYGKQPIVSAIVANSDLVAIGLNNRALEFGLTVPKDLSIISVDGTDICSMFRPQITSVTQSFHKMGVLGVQQLMAKTLPTASTKITPIKIEERNSTRQIESARSE